jgi:HSP20 family protein
MATAITRRRPFADFADLHTRLDRLFEDFVANDERREWTPAIDVIRNQDKIVVRVDMPGIKPEEIKVEVDDDILTVSGEHEESKEEKDEKFVRRERRYGSFMRSIALPAGVEPDKVTAITKDGVLEVSVPMPREAKKKAVEIKPKAG